MWQFIKLAAALVAATPLVSLPASADPMLPGPAALRGPYMRVYGPTLPPYGYVRFCHEFPAECGRGAYDDKRLEATPARLRQLEAINRQTNAQIKPATDLDIYGEIERWTLPVDRGDCEDYALLKRQRLMRAGWPASSLLMTVVRDEKGEGHAVLTARTSKGDYVLDNKTDEMRLWGATPYKYVMRQSYLDPNVWLSLDPEAVRTPRMIGGTSGGNGQ